MFYLLVVLSSTLVPSIKLFISYSNSIHVIIYYLAFYIPIFSINNNNNRDINLINSISLSILYSTLLLISNLRHNFKYISGDNIITKLPLSKKAFYFEQYSNIIAVIGEELFFRYFIISILKPYIGIYSILVSAILFVHVHYINRWANIMFTHRSYIYQFMLSIGLAYIFYTTSSILGIIIGHLIFNLPDTILCFKRLKVKDNEDMFNDYA
ncbi:CPBP family intramembrane glutamic endopeptidase [Clostridium sp.]|uniref:CPBP family intramembrane glutamic endopeptidase n=1 Tax=Clostridium sp. TaxID=1506 RepID=UPI003F3BF054